ncbi:MAG: reverse transcriptase domain-containing protein [Planctomycetota bacterium]
MRSPTISTRLQRIAQQAVDYPQMVFTTLAHLMDVEFLREAYHLTPKDRAAGVDGVTAREYGENLEENLSNLHERLRGGRYKAPPVERAWLKKDEGGKRPIGKPTFEDKIVQRAVVMLFGAIYEQEFHDFSYGFREGRSAHQALHELRQQCGRMSIGWIVDADVSGFLETSSHCTPVHERFSKRFVWVSNTLITNPFRLPRRTWTAPSSPRFTRCNTVWRETPRTLVALSSGT